MEADRRGSGAGQLGAKDLLKKHSWRWRPGALPSGMRRNKPESANAGLAG